jgi:hypothetical protein
VNQSQMDVQDLKTISEVDWKKRCDDVSIGKGDLDLLVLNFLATEVRLRHAFLDVKN